MKYIYIKYNLGQERSSCDRSGPDSQTWDDGTSPSDIENNLPEWLVLFSVD